MRGTLLYEFAAFAFVVLLFVSCKKELSCESCIEDKQPPIANAGNDTTLILPDNTANLNGSLSFDPDSNITDYSWSKISGPSLFDIDNPNAVQTQSINLVSGVYLFELRVTDADNLFDTDTMQVTVLEADQPPPAIPPPSCTDCKIVFVSNRDGNPEIYSCNAKGGNISRLTNNAAIDEEPVWSPDGSLIAFLSDRSGFSEIYIMNADGSNVIQKTFSKSYSQNPTWSHDGTRITYATTNNGSSHNIWEVGVANGSPILLFEYPGVDWHPSWSPDGSTMLLVSDIHAFDFVYDIFTINSDGTNFKFLTGGDPDNFDYFYPSWSPSGTKIALSIMQTVGIDQYTAQVGIMNTDGSGITAIMNGAAPWTKISWSPDGTKILYTSLSGSTKNVSWVSVDGTKSETIVTNGWNADWQKQ